ncbi:MAG: histidinol-phosphatase [Chloroflexi bacterium]|nr:histidinol-phosphatase [Chloroflexota bacterium]
MHAGRQDDVGSLLQFAHQLLDETDAIALSHVAGGLTVTTKPDRTLVTQADTEIETRIRDRVADRYPTHTVAGEEFGIAADGGDGRWIIDPIDATHNVVRGIEIFATLMAFERDGALVVGVVSAPAMHRRWWAVRDGGAMVRADGVERPIHVSAVDDLGSAQLVFSTLRGLEDAGLGDGLRRLTAGAWRDRGFGDFWGHVLVAQGSAESMLEYGVAPWDMAAPSIIVSEAGGRMTDLDGRDSWSGPQVVTSNGVLHERILEVLRGG